MLTSVVRQHGWQIFHLSNKQKVYVFYKTISNHTKNDVSAISGVFGTINASINVGNLLAKVTNYSFEFMSSFSIKFMSKEHANNSKTLTLILEAYYCRGIEWVQRGFVSLNLFMKNKFHLYSTLIVTRTLTRRAPKFLILPTLSISFLFSLSKTSWNLHLSRPALTSEQCSFFLQFLVHSKVPYNN